MQIHDRFDIIYRMDSPIDEWMRSVTLHEALGRGVAHHDFEYGSQQTRRSLEERIALLDTWEAAFAMLKDNPRSGWEGPIVGIPSVVTAPAATGYDFDVLAFVLKEVNNGNTYVLSRVEMPWLAAERLA